MDMTRYLCLEGAGPLFSQALEQLLEAHVADLRPSSSNAPPLRIQHISMPRLPAEPSTPRHADEEGDRWNLPYHLSGDKGGLQRLLEPPQPAAQEIPSTPTSTTPRDAKKDNCSAAIKIDTFEEVGNTLTTSNSMVTDCDTGFNSGRSISKASDFSNYDKVKTLATALVLGDSTIFRLESVSQDSFKGRVRFIVNHRYFEGFFSAIIFLNCITMGLEAEQDVKGPINNFSEGILMVSEHLFTAFFTIELMFKFAGYGCSAFTPSFPDGKWNIADVFLVLVTGVLFTWILPILSSIFDFDNEGGAVSTLTIFRSVRLLRLVRVLQRLPAFREAWLLMRGLLDSTRVLLWTVMVIFFITYIFAILGLVTVSKELVSRRDSAQHAGDVKTEDAMTTLLEFVGGLDLLMYTLVQLLTLDSWNGIVRDIVKVLSWAWIYFYAYIAVAVFVLMNLVTAIIVDNALSNSRLDETEALKRKEKKEKDELKQLEGLFNLMDADGSGTLSWEEFKAAFEDPEMKRKWKLLDFEPEECKELWGLLDDGDGEIETSEFFQGLSKMKGMAQSKDIFRVQKDVKTLMKSIDRKSVV